MTAFDRAIVLALPLAPRPLVDRVAARYMAGTSIEDALALVARLNDDGAVATVDVLGEEITSAAQADATVGEYCRLLGGIGRAGVQAGVSVKLTALGLLLGEDEAYRRVCRIVDASDEAGRFVRIDMEDSSTTEATLRIYERLRAHGYRNVGVVIQSMLRRSLDDVRRLLALGEPDVRVCKGIYVEPHAVAYQDPELIRRNYVRLCEELLDGGGRLGAATHDERLVYEVRRLAERLDPGRERHEFQMLLGVEARLRDLLLAEGDRLRIYVPYGAESYAYALRRLQENPKIAGYVVRDLAATLRERGGEAGRRARARVAAAG